MKITKTTKIDFKLSMTEIKEAIYKHVINKVQRDFTGSEFDIKFEDIDKNLAISIKDCTVSITSIHEDEQK